tara:strand:+ start:219 stop:626 length:408 start_codon:yes stop_codon:yes gene_type:complete
MRLCANTGFHLHLIKPLGFEINNKELKRAGLDYYKNISLDIYDSIENCFSKLGFRNFYLISKFGKTKYCDAKFNSEAVLLFGSELNGLPEHLFDLFSFNRKLYIPMQNNSRSLNLSNAVSILAYEAWSQLNFKFL